MATLTTGEDGIIKKKSIQDEEHRDGMDCYVQPRFSCGIWRRTV